MTLDADVVRQSTVESVEVDDFGVHVNQFAEGYFTQTGHRVVGCSAVGDYEVSDI